MRGFLQFHYLCLRCGVVNVHWHWQVGEFVLQRRTAEVACAFIWAPVNFPRAFDVNLFVEVRSLHLLWDSNSSNATRFTVCSRLLWNCIVA